MQKIIIDSYLGTIQRYGEYNSYKGSFFLKENQTIEFNFDVDDNLEEMLKTTRNLIKKVKSRDSEFKLYIAKHLLDLYNDDWSELEMIDREEFANRISLDSITIYDDNSAEIYYRDADLFAGHFIAVSLDSEGKLEEPYLAG